MRAGFLLLVATVAVASASEVLDPAADDKTIRPLMVPSLDGHVPEPHHAAAQVVTAAQHGFDGSAPLAGIKERIHGYEEMLEQLAKQLEHTMKQSVKLKLTKALMAAIVSLKKAEKVLHAIDEAVERAKGKVARYSEDIEATARRIKESEAQHKAELVSMNKELDAIRGSLAKHEKRLSALAGRRGRVVAVVSKWRAHVATLRDAHEAYTAGLAGKGAHAHAHGAHKHALDAALSSLSSPPDAASVLKQLGLAAPKGSAALAALRGKGPLDAVLKEANPATVEAAIAELQRGAGVHSRFAAANAEAEAGAEGEAAAASASSADAAANAELEREAVGLESDLAEEGAEEAGASAEAHLAEAEAAAQAAGAEAF